MTNNNSDDHFTDNFWRQIVLENSLDAVIGINDSSIIIDWNKGAEKIFGWSKEEALNASLPQLIIPIEYREAHYKGLVHFFETGEGPILNKRIEILALHRSGKIFPIELTVIPILKDGKYSFYSFLRDLTIYKQQALEIEQEKEKFKAIIDQTIVGIAQIDMKGNFVLVNDRFCEMVGRTKDELYTMKMSDITMKENLPENYALLQRMFETGENFQIEKGYIKPDGKIIWVNNSVSLIRDKNSKPMHAVAVCLDITARKEDDFKKAQDEKRNQFLLDSANVLNTSLDYTKTIRKVAALVIPNFGDWCYIHLKDDEGKIELAHLTAKNKDQEETLKSFLSRILSLESENAVVTVFKTETSILRNSINDEYYVKVSGEDTELLKLFRELHPQAVIVVPLVSRGNMMGTFTISYASSQNYSPEDLEVIEEVARRAALAIDNARLYQDSKKAVKLRDEFLSVASHELRTPVTSLKLQTQLYKRKLFKGELELGKEIVANLLTNFEKNISRLGKLIEDTLDISKIDSGQYHLDKLPLNLSGLIQDYIEQFYKDHVGETVEIDFQASGELNGNWDQLRLEQVFTNLISNSIKYAQGKPIHIKAIDQGPDVLISVSDEGAGINQEDLQRIFNRFERAMSPKGISGLGLGLYITRRIIEAHGGKIWAESEINKGTTFFIQLPKNHENPQE